jgi:parallel beta-helix repeat protein
LGIDLQESLSASIMGNQISYNGHHGIEISSGSSILVDSNIITHNDDGHGVGLENVSDEPPSTISNNIISHNFEGGVRLDHSSPKVFNNVIIYNVWGGIFCDESSSVMTNNVVSDNTGFGGIYSYGSSLVVTNNIVFNNFDFGVYSENSSPTISYNNVFGNGIDYEGCSAGPGDISEDPLFVDPVAQDYHLQQGSPCIDAGTNDAPGLPETDFYGNPRVIDGDGDGEAVVDMGPFELNIPTGENIQVTLDSNATVTFSEVTSPGYITLTIAEAAPVPPEGFELLGQYFDISTTATYLEPCIVSYNYDDTGLTAEEERDLELMHWNETTEMWEDVTDYGYPDIENNIIQGTVDTLSLFAVMISPYVSARIDFDPDSLNLESGGEWITCYIELPTGYDAGDIDANSVALTRINDDLLDPPFYRVGPLQIGDFDEDDISDLMVKFDRQEITDALEEMIEPPADVELTVCGALIDDQLFDGSDVIHVF